MWEDHWALYKRIWFSNAIGSLLQPFLYLLGMGIGVGALVDESGRSESLLGGASYLSFLASALIAVTAMMIGSTESLWPLLDGFLWSNKFRAMAATPLRPSDVANGAALWFATRCLIGSGAVAAVLVLFDDTRSWGLLPAVGFGILTGLSFAMPLSAWTATRQRDISFPAILRFGIIPMFLFAGAFFPIDQLPIGLRPLAWITPLWHGVELCRGAVLGTLGAAKALGHVAVLLAFTTVGILASHRTFTRRLET